MTVPLWLFVLVVGGDLVRWLFQHHLHNREIDKLTALHLVELRERRLAHESSQEAKR